MMNAFAMVGIYPGVYRLQLRKDNTVSKALFIPYENHCLTWQASAAYVVRLSKLLKRLSKNLKLQTTNTNVFTLKIALHVF